MAQAPVRPSPTAEQGACRSCDAPVWWVITAAAGQRMPLDADPDPDGSIEMVMVGGLWLASVLEQTEALFDVDGSVRWRPHFASCPYADQWHGAERERR